MSKNESVSAFGKGNSLNAAGPGAAHIIMYEDEEELPTRPLLAEEFPASDL